MEEPFLGNACCRGRGQGACVRNVEKFEQTWVLGPTYPYRVDFLVGKTGVHPSSVQCLRQPPVSQEEGEQGRGGDSAAHPGGCPLPDLDAHPLEIHWGRRTRQGGRKDGLDTEADLG